MASVDFYAGEDFAVNILSGSGLGFYGTGGFGSSVSVGAWQDATFITNSLGTLEGAQVDNIQFVNSASGSINGASAVALTRIPNYLATLNIRFTHSSSVQVQNVEARVYDRSNINNNPSGVSAYLFEAIHVDTVQNDNGSGDTSWVELFGSGSTLSLAQSPGISGIYAGNGSSSTRPDTQHDWFVGISCSPDSVGSKYFALYASVEYL